MKNLLIPIDPNITKPLYLQIVDYITRLAKNGQLRPGQQLPPSRTLADQTSVHRSTVINAYEELKARGVIETRQGSGSYIAPGLVEAPIAIQPTPSVSGSRPDELVTELWRLQWTEGMISLGLALPADELMPVDEFERARQQVLRRDGPKAANYEQPQGFFPLRQAIAADLVRHGILVEADDIVVTAGALEGNSLVARALAAPGDHVLTEVPQYFGNLSNLIYLGLNPVGFELFETGIDWDALDRLLQAAPARSRFVFVTPDHQNPLGIRWDMTQRHRFLKQIGEHDLPIVEDVTYRDLTFDGPPHLPLRALDPEVIYVGTFSHALIPGLRIGFVVCSGRLRDHIIRLKSVTSGAGETLNQRALAEYLKSGEYDRHLERITPVYRARRDALLEALDAYFPAGARWSTPSGGFCIWVWLPDALPSLTFFRRAIQIGITVAPAEAFYLDRPTQNGIRLVFTRYPEEVLVRAVQALARLAEGLLRAHA